MIVAKNTTKKAFCHVVGLGLGVWQVVNSQGDWLLDVFADALATGAYPHISDVDFSWFPNECVKCGPASHGEKIHNVKISFSKRNPSDPFTGEDEGKLLVAMYAWDGNSYPGNEYWGGMLTASGDPAAACCSTIPELQNPEINHSFLENIFECPRAPARMDIDPPHTPQIETKLFTDPVPPIVPQFASTAKIEDESHPPNDSQ